MANTVPCTAYERYRRPFLSASSDTASRGPGPGACRGRHIFSLTSHYLLGYTHLTFAHIDLALLIPFLLGVMGPNILLKAYRPAWGLRSRELLFVFILGWVGFMVPTWGMSNYVVSIMASAEYYASPENQWRELFFPYLPDWLVVTNEQNANSDYYWGLPENSPIPWAAWIIPSILVAVVFRRTPGRRYMFRHPDAQAVGGARASFLSPRADSGRDDRDHQTKKHFAVPTIMRHRLFLIGAVATFSIMLWNTAAYWTQWFSFPIDANVALNVELGRSFPAHPIRMNVITFAFSYFINMDILFSVWFFQIINTLEQGILARVGITARLGYRRPRRPGRGPVHWRHDRLPRYGDSGSPAGTWPWSGGTLWGRTRTCATTTSSSPTAPP